MSDKIPMIIPTKYKPRMGKLARNLPPNATCSTLLLSLASAGFSLVFTEEKFYNGNGMAVSSGREEMARKRALPQNSGEGKRRGREGGKERARHRGIY